MTPRLRRFAVLSFSAVYLSCSTSSDPPGAAGAGATSSTTATETATSSAWTSASTSSSAVTSGSTSSSGAVSSASTSGTGGAATGATAASVAATTDAGGAAGATNDPTATTGGGGTDGGDQGVFLIQDSCSHEACGGAVAGSAWRYTRACVTAEQIVGPMQSFCPSITLIGSSGELSGSISFDDTSYTQEISFSLTIELDVPSECDITCPSFAATLAVMGFPGATCEEGTTSCHCVGTAQGSDPRSGGYAVDDVTLTLMGLGDVEAGYCAGENSFSYAPPVMLVPQGTPMDVVYETVRQ